MTLLLWLAACTVDTSKSTDPVDDTDVVAPAPIDPYDPLPLVDPFIATGGDGAQIANVNPGASLPWGLTHTGPDTRTEYGAAPFYHCAGYWYNDTHVHTFTHNHVHGMGVTDFGGVGFMATNGWDPSYTGDEGRMATFSHDEESASPGRYQVKLGNGVNVEIAATLRGQHTRMTWDEGGVPVVLFDLGPSIPDVDIPEANLSWTPGTGKVTGYQLLSGNYSGRDGGLMTWFEAQLDPAPIASGGWDSPDAPVDGATAAAGTSAGLWFRFPEGTTAVDLRVALSYVDAAGAAANHAAELGDLDWTARADAGADAWREVLRRVRVRGGSDDQRKIFHTALFHAALMPRRQDDVDGRYRGLDRQVHTTDHPYYSDMSLWDTFRTLHPWYMLAWPEVQLDVNRSLARMTRDGGSLPRWPIGHGYTGGMVGTPAAQVLAESWLKGIQDFDVDTTFDAAVATSRGPVARDSRGGAEAYAAKGWIGADEGGGSVANTLEYAWSDRAIASWGAAMGREVPDVLERSHGWENLFNTDVGFFTGRCVSAAAEACTEDGADDGWVWLTEENEPEKFWLDHFVEGNSWHYLWYVPYDVPAMVDVQHGGDTAAFVARLRTYWYDGVFREHDDVLPDDYYWHGNEPVMHYAFLGSLAGDPDITADAARWVMMNRYFAAPYGLDGNDDAGTLSAWYLLASTGFFPVAGTTTYAVSSPLFERTEIDRAGQTPLVFDAPATSDDARYVRELIVGGEVLSAPQVDHAALMEAGGATFTMSAVEGGWGGG